MKATIRHWSCLKTPQVNRLCGVTSIGQSIETACNGRWETKEPCETVALDRAQQHECCAACWSVYVDQRAESRGIRELADGTFSRIGLATRAYEHALEQFSAADAAGFRAWLGPCAHNQSPVTRCAICAPSATNSPQLSNNG